ncbi:MAG: dTDP-4-dehydrorhamnose 3,5-epimerase [Candidatus Saganbacteria bacterium]|nr:dTDP-4-dehydrorhamnose 3,5-epimerase [Candidatus Saganbacteria bacterium]
MKFNKTKIPAVIIVEPNCFPDQRGFFMESYKYSEFAASGIPERFVQDNYSRSTKGTLRGMHYQLNPNAQGKLVRVTVGEIFDVGVDLRKGSPTYGKYVAEVLSAENRKMAYIPPGFAHGFYTLSDVAEVEYKCTAEYFKKDERALAWDAPEVGIAWPLKPGEKPILSEKDLKHPSLKNVETNFVYTSPTYS